MKTEVHLACMTKPRMTIVLGLTGEMEHFPYMKTQGVLSLHFSLIITIQINKLIDNHW